MDMTRHPQHEELQRLISALLDNRLSPEDRARLEALLAADSQARLLYMQMVDQEIELPCLIAAIQDADSAPVPRGFLELFGALFSDWRRWALGVACILAVMTLLAVLWRPWIEPT